MSWREQIFIYCERGSDPSFLAEPLNAVTNLAFLAAAGLAWRERSRRGSDQVESLVLILNVAAIGIGSFLFHTLAERWSSLADIIPIGVFMLLYLAIALRSLLGLGVVATTLLALLFALACYGATLPRCEAGACLGGSIAYFPAAGSLIALAAALALTRHPAAVLVSSAAALLVVSLTLRTLDWPLCGSTVFGGAPIGLHFTWHLLNGLLLYLLLLAIVRHGDRREAG